MKKFQYTLSSTVACMALASAFAHAETSAQPESQPTLVMSASSSQSAPLKLESCEIATAMNQVGTQHQGYSTGHAHLHRVITNASDNRFHHVCNVEAFSDLGFSQTFIVDHLRSSKQR